MQDKHIDDLREKFDWVRTCQCERPLCAEEIAKGEHDQSKTGCPSCDFAHAGYPLFRNKEVLALITIEQFAILERLMENGHGGGNWRRLITLEIDRIGGKE